MGGHLCLLCFIRQARVLIFLRKKTWNFLECSKNHHNTLKYQNTSYSVTDLICASPKWILSKTVTTQNNITNTRGAQIELFMLEFIFIVFKFRESDQKEQIGCWIWSWWTTGFFLLNPETICILTKLLPNLLTSSDAVQVTEFAIRYGIQSIMDLLDWASNFCTFSLGEGEGG